MAKEREYTIGEENNHCYFQDFEGINEFADYLEKNEFTSEWLQTFEGRYVLSKLQKDEYDRSDARFRGVSGYSDAKNKLLNGTNVREIKRARAASLTTDRPKAARGVCGGVPIVPSYLSGNPMSMMTLKPRPERRSLRIFVDCAMPSRVRASEITRAGEKIVAALAKVDAIANYDLVAGSVTYDYWDTHNIYGLGITIKTAGKPFSASRVSFCLTSPAFLRVFEFMWDGKNHNIKPMEGFGRSLSHAKPGIYRELIEKHHANTIVIPLEYVVEQGEYYINKKFKEAGIQL